MDSIEKPPVNPIAFAQKIQNENNKTIRELFKSKINASFLIKIKSMVQSELGPALFQYYPIRFDNATRVSGNEETPEYDICRIIIGVHRHHSIFLSEQEIRRMQHSEEYQRQLVNEVIEKIQLREFGSTYFRKKQLLLGDEFLYFPVPYELFAMCIRSIRLMHNNSNIASAYPLSFEYCNVLSTALSSLTLLENNLLSSAYPLCRGMIEQYLKVLILKQHPEQHKDFEKFRQFEIDQSCCSQKYPAAFVDLYNNRCLLSCTSKANYLHYGWLDEIKDYTTQKATRYSIYGILEYLMHTADDDERKTLHQIETLYKMCHGYTHGSAVSVKYPLLQYFEISIMLFHIVTAVFSNIYAILNTDLLPEDKLLLDILNRDYDILSQQYSIRSGLLFDSYYGTHK